MGSTNNSNLMVNFNNNMVPVSNLTLYFFNLNNWPIDNAPKVSNSSYLVGVLFVLLFHVYGFNTLENFSSFFFEIFGVNFQFLSFFFFFTVVLLFAEDSSRTLFGIFFIFYFLFFIFIFYYYNNKTLLSSWYNGSTLFTSTYLVITWEFFLFFFFFIGWVFKLSNKYSLESFTNNEGFLYSTIAPSLFFFEIFTFGYCLIWRYVNFTLVGYPTIMYLNVFNVVSLSGVLITKLFFYSSVYIAFLVLVKLLNNSKLTLFILYLTFIILYLTFFLINEFSEFWSSTHSVVPSNTLNFTFFNYFLYILFFNFLHAYIVVLINYLVILIYLSNSCVYEESFEFLHLTVNNFYFIMWLTLFLLLSTYAVTDLGLYVFFF